MSMRFVSSTGLLCAVVVLGLAMVSGPAWSAADSSTPAKTTDATNTTNSNNSTNTNNTTPAAKAAASFTATIETIGPGAATIDVDLNGLAGVRRLKIPRSTDRERFADAQKGDQVRLQVDDVAAPAAVTEVTTLARPTSASRRIWTLAVALAVVLAAAAAVTRGRPWSLLIGADNRYSNSQTQLALWSATVATVYLTSIALRWAMLGGHYVGGVELPGNLIGLTGLSALTFGGAKVIVQQKLATASPNPPAAPVAPAVLGAPPATPQTVATPTGPAKAPSPKASVVTDLFQNDTGQSDLGDLQMMMITVVAIGIFGLSAFEYLGALALDAHTTLPDIDTALLSGFGIGQGAYLLKKAALPLGQG